MLRLSHTSGLLKPPDCGASTLGTLRHLLANLELANLELANQRFQPNMSTLGDVMERGGQNTHTHQSDGIVTEHERKAWRSSCASASQRPSESHLHVGIKMW